MQSHIKTHNLHMFHFCTLQNLDSLYEFLKLARKPKRAPTFEVNLSPGETDLPASWIPHMSWSIITSFQVALCSLPYQWGSENTCGRCSLFFQNFLLRLRLYETVFVCCKWSQKFLSLNNKRYQTKEIKSYSFVKLFTNNRHLGTYLNINL